MNLKKGKKKEKKKEREKEKGKGKGKGRKNDSKLVVWVRKPALPTNLKSEYSLK